MTDTLTPRCLMLESSDLKEFVELHFSEPMRRIYSQNFFELEPQFYELLMAHPEIKQPIEHFVIECVHRAFKKAISS